MKRFLPWLVGLVTLAAGCAHNQNLERPETQDNYGVRMAKENLWREAMFRFQRAVEIAPGDARGNELFREVLRGIERVGRCAA